MQANATATAVRHRPAVGFTLIELLVVIAIISVLAAILFPVFVKARGRAHATACLSNVRQVATAFLMYAQDSDEMLPTIGYDPGRWPYADGTYVARVLPYIKNTDVLYCPDRETEAEPQFPPAPWNGSRRRLGYGTNFGVWYDDTGLGIYQDYYAVGGGTYPGRALADFPAPADAVLLGDTNDSVWMSLAFYYQHYDGGNPTVLRHQWRNNYAFVDGHVKPIRVAPYRASGVFTVMPTERADIYKWCYRPDALPYEGRFQSAPYNQTCRQWADSIADNRTLLQAAP